MTKIAIIDYGLGNLRSVMRGLEKAGANAVITSEKEEIAAADGLVLPGVGAFREGMDQLGPLKETVIEATRHVPLLGICLGMQMLMDTSEEHGIHQGLGLIPGRVKRFARGSGYKVPHMGWNSLELSVLIIRFLPGSALMNMSTLFIHFMSIRPLNIHSRPPVISVLFRHLLGKILPLGSSFTRKRAARSAFVC